MISTKLVERLNRETGSVIQLNLDQEFRLKENAKL
jgi:hypothetical protein